MPDVEVGTPMTPRGASGSPSRPPTDAFWDPEDDAFLRRRLASREARAEKQARVCACDGCPDTTTEGRYCWPCWSRHKDHGRCALHEERGAPGQRLGTRISLRADPENAVYGSGMGETDEPYYGGGLGPVW